MIRAIDHVVILVDDLAQTSADYAALGFTVVPGGMHADGASHNALVVFGDGAYFELIAFTRPAREHRWWQFGQSGATGLIDYALLPSDIIQDVSDARARGLALDGPTSGARVRPDGERLAWQSARARSSDVPFLCADSTPRVLRVPEGDARRHENGAQSIAGITIAVDDLEASVARYQALLGEPFVASPAVVAGLGMRAAAAYLGGTRITLASPSEASGPAGAALREHLARQGEGPYAVAVVVSSDTRLGALDPRQTHGARLEFVAAPARKARAFAA